MCVWEGGGGPSESYRIKTSARKIYGMKPLWCVSSDDVVTLDIVITILGVNWCMLYRRRKYLQNRKIPPKPKKISPKIVKLITPPPMGDGGSGENVSHKVMFQLFAFP